MSFEKHLFSLNFTSKTVNRYLVWEREFKRYFEGQTIQELSYNDLLSYFQDKQSKQLTRSTLVHILSRIKRYYSYLGVNNPLENFQLKGYDKPRQIHYLSVEELEGLEQLCKPNTWLKVMLSLLVYQGLATEELPHLRVNNVDLQSGVLHVPVSNLATRAITLEACQMLLLLDYTQNKKAYAKLLPRLSIGRAGNHYNHLNSQIKKELSRNQKHIPFKNLSQLRSSRIRLWIEKRGILEAQYLAGHRSLISTQYYQKEESAALRTTFENIHPMF